MKIHNFTRDTVRLAIVDVGAEGRVETTVELAGSFVPPRAVLAYEGVLPGGARLLPSLALPWPGFPVQDGRSYYLARRGHAYRLLELPETIVDPRVD